MTISLRPATSRDLGFVFSLAQNGARHGHFDPNIVHADKAVFRQFLNSAISHGVDLAGNTTFVLVACMNDIRIGAAIVTTPPGAPDRGVELAMIVLKNEFRDKGYGSVILDAFLNEYLHKTSVYALCLPASEKLHQMLLRRDFDEVGTLGGGVLLRHEAVNPGW